MAEDPQSPPADGWFEKSGLLPIFRTPGLAVQPAKLGIALVALIATLLLGTVLDWAWTSRAGVGETAIVDFIDAAQMGTTYSEPPGDHGLFEVFWAHERQCLLESVEPSGGVRRMAYGACWLARHHPCFFTFFALGSLAIWSLAGGAICRITALQFARGEQLTMIEGFTYARKKFGSFFLAPCLPVLLSLVVMLFMVLGGVVLRIPILGDLVGGVAFGLAIFGGFVITLLLLGLLVSGSLFFPTVAAEDADLFDAFGRSLPYACFRPWKTVFYAVVTLFYAAICWVFVRFFAHLTLSITHAVVSFGTSPFGWWSRVDDGNPTAKLELLWPISDVKLLQAFPQSWENVGPFESVSAVLIGFWVLAAIGLMWSFLASFYFSASTVIYFLLRRDVDGTDLSEVFVDEKDETEGNDETKEESA